MGVNGCLRQWYHIGCLFDTFNTATPSTRIISNLSEDVEGWESVYLARHELHTELRKYRTAGLNVHMPISNWISQPAHPSVVITENLSDEFTISDLRIDNNNIIFAMGPVIQLHSTITGARLRTFSGEGDVGNILSFKIYENVLVSCSTRDKNIKVWSLESGDCLHRLAGHTERVLCLQVLGKKIVSGSWDMTARVWNVDSGECSLLLVGHTGAVETVNYQGQIIISGARDSTIRVWHPDSGECLRTLHCHEYTTSIKIDHTRLIARCWDNTIQVWSTQNWTCQQSMELVQISVLNVHDSMIIQGDILGRIRLWNVNGGQNPITFAGKYRHVVRITGIQCIEHFLISSDKDGYVKIWNITTGEFVRNIVVISCGYVENFKVNNTTLVCAVRNLVGSKILIYKYKEIK